MKFFNTYTGKKDEFVPIEEGKVRLYTCGPTVYNYAHIGNLRTYIFEDILKKSLEYNGYEVAHVMNITDVGHLESDGDEGEDKMAMGASREKKTVWEIARFYEEAFLGDCGKLNIKRPTVVCRATEHIKDMIDFIQVLERKGFTYTSNGNVYFSIDQFPDYPKLAKLSLEELEAGNRIEVDPNKKNPLDFVLWFTNSKFSNQIMQWESPWGVGFPGWHIECSAMSMKYLGDRIDIHCGGVDHIPVHHTNEIAQSESAVGHKWVNHWMHGEFLVLDKGKMSKSGGEFLTVERIVEKGFDPMDYRFFCLQSNYRKQLVFSYESLEDAKTAYRKLRNRIGNLMEEKGLDAVDAGMEGKSSSEAFISYQKRFKEQISDDLNTANALTVLFDVLKAEELDGAEKLALIKDFDRVLSLDLLEKRKPSAAELTDSISEQEIAAQIQQRNEARQSKNWALADQIRNELLEKGIELLDTKEGTTWKHRD